MPDRYPKLAPVARLKVLLNGHPRLDVDPTMLDKIDCPPHRILRQPEVLAQGLSLPSLWITFLVRIDQFEHEPRIRRLLFIALPILRHPPHKRRIGACGDRLGAFDFTGGLVEDFFEIKHDSFFLPVKTSKISAIPLSMS